MKNRRSSGKKKQKKKNPDITKRNDKQHVYNVLT